MLEKLRTRGGDVEYGIKFVTAEPQDDYVNVTADRNGERTSFTAFFLVGCDGAHSSVRHGLGLALEGGECHDSFMLADIETNEVLPGDEVHLGPSELGPLAIFPISAKRRRIVATIKQPQGGAPSLELVRKTLAERDRGGIEASLHSPSECDVEAQGRIFIAGTPTFIARLARAGNEY